MEPNFSISPGGAVGAAVVDQLARTKGWTRFFSIILWLGAALMILAGGGMMVFGALAGGGMTNEMQQQFAAIGGLIGMGLVYLVIAFFYIYPALKLGGYSSRITDLINTPNEANLVAALNEQRAFWKYVGIWMVVMMVLYVVIIVGAIIAAGIAAASGAAGGS
jgi:hypothetical protein